MRRWFAIAVVAGCVGGSTKSSSSVGSTSDDTGSPDGSATGVSTFTYLFTGGGSACVTSDGLPGGTSIAVDLEECWFCSTGTVDCTANLAGTQLTVEVSGAVQVQQPCDTYGTCEPVVASCAGPDLVPGTYDLVYGGATVQAVVPTTDPVCTP